MARGASPPVLEQPVNLTFGELFAGVGGFSLGFEQAGWQCRWQVEWDKHCQGVLARHWPEVERFGDVRDVAGGIIPLAGRADDAPVAARAGAAADDCQSARSVLAPVDCITFGSPCQDLSVAGKRAGLAGERSSLFHEAIRIIKEMRDATAGTFPRYAIWENVAGALSSNKGDDFLAVIDAFAEIGAVDVAWRLVDAQFFGVPQRRRRVFVVADFAGECAGALHAEPAGVRWHPAPSRTAGPHSAASVTECPPPRRLTPLEAERLMGWPDDHTRWRADGTEQADSHRYRQCGNGVAAPVAAWLAWNLRTATEQDLNQGDNQ